MSMSTAATTTLGPSRPRKAGDGSSVVELDAAHERAIGRVPTIVEPTWATVAAVDVMAATAVPKTGRDERDPDHGQYAVGDDGQGQSPFGPCTGPPRQAVRVSGIGTADLGVYRLSGGYGMTLSIDVPAAGGCDRRFLRNGRRRSPRTPGLPTLRVRAPTTDDQECSTDGQDPDRGVSASLRGVPRREQVPRNAPVVTQEVAGLPCVGVRLA
jgi:hypothetical protein